MLAEYVKVIPLLTIDPTQRLQTRVKELETGLAQEIAQQSQGIDNLKAQMRQMEVKNLEMWKKSLTISFKEWTDLMMSHKG
jgi:hypothetical protein